VHGVGAGWSVVLMLFGIKRFSSALIQVAII
jgi:hypothetical protein